MRLYSSLEVVRRDPATVLTVGSFDGVHIGHQALLHRVTDRARAQNARSTLLTFEPHPRRVLTGQSMPLLTSTEEKARLLEGLGLDRLIVAKFSGAFASLLPEDYVREVLVEGVGLQEIVVGHDHGFGRGRAGNVALLRRMGRELGFSVDMLPAQYVGNTEVSSRVIRDLIARNGDVKTARVMLTRPYAVQGCVVRGQGRGHAIGFPTANLSLTDPCKVIPRRGVYVVEVVYGKGQYYGVVNVGVRPTVEEEGRLQLEVHLFDFNGDLYGKALDVRFLDRLRNEKKFASVKALSAQLRRDVAKGRQRVSRMNQTAEYIVP